MSSFLCVFSVAMRGGIPFDHAMVLAALWGCTGRVSLIGVKRFCKNRNCFRSVAVSKFRHEVQAKIWSKEAVWLCSYLPRKLSRPYYKFVKLSLLPDSASKVLLQRSFHTNAFCSCQAVIRLLNSSKSAQGFSSCSCCLTWDVIVAKRAYSTKRS